MEVMLVFLPVALLFDGVFVPLCLPFPMFRMDSDCGMRMDGRREQEACGAYDLAPAGFWEQPGKGALRVDFELELVLVRADEGVVGFEGEVWGISGGCSVAEISFRFHMGERRCDPRFLTNVRPPNNPLLSPCFHLPFNVLSPTPPFPFFHIRPPQHLNLHPRTRPPLEPTPPPLRLIYLRRLQVDTGDPEGMLWRIRAGEGASFVVGDCRGGRGGRRVRRDGFIGGERR